jgi:hypothetical protein
MMTLTPGDNDDDDGSEDDAPTVSHPRAQPSLVLRKCLPLSTILLVTIIPLVNST